MIEPPRKPLVRAILEIDDCIFVAVKLITVECISGAVHSRRIGDLRVRIERRAVKFGKDRGR
jgi:hypothetical protein